GISSLATFCSWKRADVGRDGYLARCLLLPAPERCVPSRPLRYVRTLCVQTHARNEDTQSEYVISKAVLLSELSILFYIFIVGILQNSQSYFVRAVFRTVNTDRGTVKGKKRIEIWPYHVRGH